MRSIIKVYKLPIIDIVEVVFQITYLAYIHNLFA